MFNNSLRRFADRIRRRTSLLLGKPDPTPWVIAPSSPTPQHRYVDFMFGLDYLSQNSNLVRSFTKAMSPLGISTLLVNDSNVHHVIQQVQSAKIRPYVYLDLCSRPDSPYHTLLESAAAQGVHTLRNPSQTKWTLKAQSHNDFANVGLPVPPTVLFQPNDPDRELTPEERLLLGERCVVKPSFGEMQRGVKLNVKPTLENIADARNYNRKDAWLVQKMISWGRCGTRPAYLRAYNILGHRSILWWAAQKEPYALLTWDDFQRYDLAPALDIIDRLANLTGVEFFSTEIAITAPQGPNRFVMIDYLNDCCDLAVGSGSGHPPEQWVEWVVERFAEFTFRIKNNLGPGETRSVWLGPPNPANLQPPQQQTDPQPSSINAA